MLFSFWRLVLVFGIAGAARKRKGWRRAQAERRLRRRGKNPLDSETT
jgi:hypothetical protein